MTARPIDLVCVALLALGPSAALAEARVVLLPLQGLARAQSARTLLQSAIATELRAKGYGIAPEAQVEAILEELRIRYLDSLTPAQLALLLSRTGADVAILGTVLDYAPAQDTSVAIHLHAEDRSGTRWSRIVALRSSQAIGPLGEVVAKSPDELAALLLIRELEDFPRAGAPFPPPRRDRGGAPPGILFAAELPARRPRVAVLPFGNRSLLRRAGAVAEVAVLDALSRCAAVEPVAPALLRSAIVTAGLQTLSSVDPETARALARELGTTLFVQGTILRYEPDVPEVELHVTLTDLETGRIYWSGLARRRGSEYEDWLAPGTVKDPARLLSLAAGELVDAFTARPKSRRPNPPEER